MEKSTQSLLMATATGAMVLGIFNGVAPSVTDVSASGPSDQDIAKNTKVAAWMAGGLVAGVSVLMRDPTVFVLGSAITIGYTWWLNGANHSWPSPVSASVTMSMGHTASAPTATPTPEEPAADTSAYHSF
jgi:hypothetical protein